MSFRAPPAERDDVRDVITVDERDLFGFHR